MTDIATLSIAVDSRDVPRAAKEMDKLEASSKSLESGIKALIGVWASWEIGKHLTDLAMLSARFETIGIAMNQVGQNAGYTSTQMQQYEMQLRSTGISAIESRDSLTKMAAANLDLAQSSRLARVAQDAAVIGNINSSEAFAALIHGVQSGQTEVLRNIGIMVNFESVYKKTASTLGIATSELNETQKMTARMNAVLEAGELRAGVYEAAMGTAGKQIKSMERYMQDLEVAAGNTMGPALTAGVEMLSQAFKAANKAMEDWNKSGNQGVFAMKLRDDLVKLGEAVANVTGWMSRHSEAVVILAAAYGSFRISEYILKMGSWVDTQVKSVSAHIAATTAASREAETVTKAALAKAGFTYNTKLSNEAQIAEAQTMLVHNSLALQSAVATGAMTEAEAALVRQKQAEIATDLERAEAATTASRAQGVASVAMGGVSGGLTLLITLLGTAATAWMMFKDSTDSESKDAAKFMDERIRRAEENIAKTKRFWEAIAKGKTASEAESASWSALDDPASHKGMETINRAQQELAKATTAYAAISKQMGVRDSAEEVLAAWKKGQVVDVALLDLARNRVKAQESMNAAISKEQQLVEALNNEHAQQEYKEKYVASKVHKSGSGSGKEGNDDTSVPPTIVSFLAGRHEIGDLIAYHDAVQRTYKGTNEEQAKLIENDKRRREELIPTVKVSNEYVDALADLNRMLAFGQIGQREYNEGIQTAWEKYTNAGMAAVKLRQEVERLNQRTTPEDAMAHLGDLKSHGLQDEAYARKLAEVRQLRIEYLRLKAEAGDAWAAIGYVVTQNSENASDAMVRWMDNLDGLGHSWKSLGDTVGAVLRDMVVQMQKALIQQQLMKPLFEWAGLKLGLDVYGVGTPLDGGVRAGSLIGGAGSAPTGYGTIPEFAVGTNYVPKDMLAVVHEGEAIIPKAYNPGRGGSGDVNTNVTVIVQSTGAKTDSADDQRGRDAGDSLLPYLNAWAIDQKRVGGVFEGVN